MFADVIVNLLAALIFFVLVDILARKILEFVGGSRPRFHLTTEYRTLKDVDWIHVRVHNVGLPLSPHTRAAHDAIAYGRVDTDDVEFQWATTERVAATRESMPIYYGRPRDIPLAVRIRPGFAPTFWGGQTHQVGVACLTEVEYLTQYAAGKAAPHALSQADHRVVLTVKDGDGNSTTSEFVLTVPPFPAEMTLRKVR